MPIQQLDSFMDAIAAQESGHDYGAVGPDTAYGNALGKYQIMSDFWDGWAKQAGIPGADWKDPKAQEKVARHKMTQYYNRYGSWDLVAVAWFAGPGRANTAVREGIQAVGSISDVLGTDVAEYVRTMQSTMGSPSPSGTGGRRPGLQPGLGRQTSEVPAGEWDAAAEATGRTPGQRFVDQRQASSEAMSKIATAISEAVQQRGGKELSVSALLGEASDDPEETVDDEEVTAGG